MNRASLSKLAVLCALALAAGCSPGGTGTNPPVTAANHTWFPLTAGANHEYGRTTSTGTIECASCHPPSADSFKEFSCTACHEHAQSFTDRLHTTLASYAYEPKSCYSCHPDGATRPYGHAGIVDRCAECHQEGGPFAALPKPGFTHRDIGASDCGACHTSTTDWKEVSAAPNDRFDPLRSVQVDALSPIWTGPVIDAVSPDPQTVHMTMNHSATSVDTNVMSTCSNCHAQADQGQYYPGVFHWSLLDLAAPQPTRCSECHAGSIPRGFVGPVDSARTPASGPMRHDAVVWANGAPTTTRIVTWECVTCHVPPDDPTEPQWFFDSMLTDGGTPHFHASLTAAGEAQPTSCIDCHANTRPRGSVTSAAVTFDHSAELGDCVSCHVSFTAWSGGVYHRAGAPTPSTCLPCHASERPTSTTGWTGSYTASPFDYGTNANGVTHGAGRDCAECHAGSTQSWVGGRFGHAAPALAATRCVDCHTTQRPDLLSPPADAGFDHAANGTGDCGACHEATVTRGTFVNLYPIPGGDWRGGQSYPGAALISVPNQSMQVLSTALSRDGGTVVGMTTTTVTLPNAFRHTSSAIPAQVFPGSATNPDQNSCWHCHTATGTTVTAYSNGVFHASLTNYRATPASGITALPQPSSCGDCHAQMRPPNIVSKTDAGTWLLPMDHAASFTGGSVPNVGAMDCGDCHNTPGLGPTRWSDGKFHTNLPTGGNPSECVSCHWPLSTTAQADVTSSTNAMKHRSPQVKTQACATCHGTALTRSTMTPTATTLWRTGALHANASPQPTACTECHSASAPTTSTQGTVTYVLAMGGTSSNGAQWMNHADPSVASRDCAACHQGDARPSGSAWSKNAPYHANVTNPSGCAKCHGTTNGRGTTIGTNNNLPAGVINSSTTTTSSAAAAGTKDQISHADSNVTRFDCSFCHTQKGPSTAAGVQGKEWAQASFHRNFTAANPALYDGTAGRCSNCHMNVKPGSAFTAYDHSAFTATPGTQDCGACHSWPGTSATTPNWLGAEGKPHADTGNTAASTLDCNSCHGQNGSAMNKLSVPPANHFGGITNGNTCTSCHVNFAGFKGTTTNLKYAHTNATANAGNGCSNCHVFASQLYTTLTTTPSLTYPVSAGSHQFSQTMSVTGRFDGDTFTKPHTDAKMTRCGSCHQYASTTSTTNVWTFKHRPSNPGISSSKSTSGCNNCH